MPSLDPGLLEWAVRAAAPGAEVAEVRGLRDGGSPWLVRLGNAYVELFRNCRPSALVGQNELIA
jgi:hypothetical protein